MLKIVFNVLSFVFFSFVFFHLLPSPALATHGGPESASFFQHRVLNGSMYDFVRTENTCNTAGLCVAPGLTSNTRKAIVEYTNNAKFDSGVDLKQMEYFNEPGCLTRFQGYCPQSCTSAADCNGGVCGNIQDDPVLICSSTNYPTSRSKGCIGAVCGYDCGGASTGYLCDPRTPPVSGGTIGPDLYTCESGRTQPYLQACSPSNCPVPSKDGKEYQCATVSGASSGPAGWSYEAGFSCGYGSGKGCFSKPILPTTCTGEIAGLNYQCQTAGCQQGWTVTSKSQLYTCSDSSQSCCFKQPENVTPNCSVGECDACGGQFGTQTVTCDGGGGGVVSCVSDVPCPPGAPPPAPPPSPTPSGSCSISLVSTTTSSATVGVTRSGGGDRNYNRVNWYKDGVFVETAPISGSGVTNTDYTLPNKTMSPYSSGTHSARALFWSEGGPGGNPNPVCDLSFNISQSPTPVGALTCCHIPGNIGRWSTDKTCPGGSAVSANFNTNTASSGYRNGSGCFREGAKPYVEDTHQVGGNAWVVDVAGNMTRPNFGHYFYWINNPSDSSTNTPNFNTSSCIHNTSYNGKSACISAYTENGTWGYTAYGGAGWGQYSTDDGGLVYRHRKPADQGAGDSGVDKRFVLLDYDHSVDPIGFLTYTEVHGTQNCGDDGCQYHSCETLNQIYSWPTNQAKFYFWNANLSSAEAGTAVVADSGTSSSHTGTLSLSQSLTNNGTTIANINPSMGYALFCTSSTQTGEMGYVLGNARIDPVFRKNLQPPAEFSLTVENACSGEASPYVQLSWTPSLGATGSYLIYRQSDANPSPQVIGVADITQTSYTDLGAGNLNQNYHYFIQAQNPDGCTRNDTPAGSCSSSGETVTWKSVNTGYCDSNPPILDDIVNLPTLPFCTVPDDRAASNAKTEKLWSVYQPIEVLAHDQGVNPSGVKQVNLTIRQDSPGVTLYPGVQTAKAASGYYEFPTSSLILPSVILNSNDYTVSAQAFDYSNNPSNVVVRYFQADTSCRCANIGGIGDVHGNTGIYTSCGD